MKTPAQIENIIKILKRNYKSIQMERAALLSTMLLSLCIFPHHAQAMQEDTDQGSLLSAPTGNKLLEIQTAVKNNAVIENYNDMQKQMDIFLGMAGLTEKQFKAIHFARNNNQNSDMNYSDISAIGSGFRKLPSEKSIFHQIGEGNENNEKWTNAKGEEYVFNLSTNPPKLVTNAVNIGTYNYRPESDTAGHYLLDVLPYLLWGNSESDSTTFEERFRLFEQAKDETTLIEKGILLERAVARMGRTAGVAAGRSIRRGLERGKNVASNAIDMTIKELKKIQADMGIENLTDQGLLLSVGKISLDYKTLDDSELGFDLISDNAQENIGVQKFRFLTDLINPQQKEERNSQSFNDDQRIRIADLAGKQRRIKQASRNQHKKSDGAGDILSAADSLRLGGNYAYGVAYGKRFISILRPYRNQSAPLTKNGGNNSASLFFDNLLEEITSSSTRFSERVKASSEGYGDYNHTAWGAWSGGQNTRLNLGNAIDYYIQARNGGKIFINNGKITGGISGWNSDLTAQGGHWVYGQKPGSADIPRSGSARYVGQLMGGFWADRRSGSSIPEINSITGDIKMAVTFRNDNNSISGSLNLKRSGADWASASFNTLNARSAPSEKFRSSDYFSTLLNSTSGGGKLTGSFFGANAAEAGGTFNLSKREGADRGSAIGVFRAKNVGSIVGNVSDADRLKLLSGNHAFALNHSPGISSMGVSPYDLPLRNGSSSSLTLRSPALKESIPNSDPAKGNTLLPSDRIKVHARDYGDYSYIAWGAWSGGKNTHLRNINGSFQRVANLGGQWIYGQKLGRTDIPRSGSARYIGQVKGSYRKSSYGNSGFVEMNSITGDINMAVTFRDGNNSLSGTMNLDRNGASWAMARFNTQNARINPYAVFETSLNLEDGYGGGYLWGDFFGFGGNADEVGGHFTLIKSNRTATTGATEFENVGGVFRAKKQ